MDERIALHGAGPQVSLLDALVYGDAGDPRGRHIARGLARYQAERAHQRAIRREIADLRRSIGADGRAPMPGRDQF